MDRIAELVGMDPWEIRFLNAYRNGDMRPHQKEVEDATLIEVMQAAAEMTGHDLPDQSEGDEFMGQGGAAWLRNAAPAWQPSTTRPA